MLAVYLSILNAGLSFTNLLESHNAWTGALDSGFGVDVIIYNYSKAFD